MRRPYRVMLLLVGALVATACGTQSETPTTDTGADAAEAGAQSQAEGEVEVAAGTVIDVGDCPSDWSNSAGVTEEEIRIAISLPESGPLAALGQIDDGMRAYFGHVNETDPIAGRELVLLSADDAYDPARTLTNVEETLATEEVLAYTWIVGTPNNLAVRDLLDDSCVPQIFNSTGFPGWGNPQEYPWTVGGLLSYQTEARIWCNYIAEELGEGAAVAGLFINNDFGQAYRNEVEACAEEGVIDLVESVDHEPSAPDVTDDVTTLAASGAEAVVLGTSGSPCPQAMTAIDASNWDPLTFLANGCQSISTYFAPIDPAGDGVLVATTAKNPGSPQYDDDEAVQEAIQILQDNDLDPYSGSSWSGIFFAHTVEKALRDAAEREGGLTRLNLMRTVWNLDQVNPILLDGITEQTDGVNDAYVLEAARIGQYQAPTGDEETGSYEFVGDLIDLEGETGSFEEE